ncbi:hypothetical protein ACOSP7_005853 [Xanthoceras sorbifolium]
MGKLSADQDTQLRENREKKGREKKEKILMSEEEFGLSINGPITLPCNSTFLKYVLSLFRGGMSEDLEKSLLTSLTTCHISVSLLGQEMSHHQQTLIYSY